MAPANARLRARWIFPSEGPPIKDGVLTIAADIITNIETETDHADSTELGNVAVIPALVNAHTHLEFSDLATPKGQGTELFADWLHMVIAHRASSGNSAADAVESGLQQCAVAGVAYVGEIATEPVPPDGLAQSTVGGTRFLELIGTSLPRVDEVVDAAREFLGASNNPSGWERGLSPHAPYSTTLNLVERVARLCGEFGAPLAMHLAESREELELLANHSGPLRQLLSNLGVWDSAAFPAGTRPIDYLQRLSRAPRSLVIHGNYLDDHELRFLAEHADRMTLVYCPRTHSFFGHDEYPLTRAIELGVAVALGTDSRASNPDLSLFRELQHAARLHPGAPARELLKAASNGQALGLSNEIAVGKPARFTLVELPDESLTEDPYELLFNAGSQPRPLQG
jgi:cytosine/adenosine deaminase-related metal-dependent hydrolase